MKDCLNSKRKDILLKIGFWILAVILGVFQTWLYRNAFWTDGIAYVDIADAYLKGDWANAINACWSPLYSWLLAAILKIFNPSPDQELSVIKLANFLVYIFCLFSFEFFLREVIQHNQLILSRREEKLLLIPEWIWTSLGYTLFIWSSTQWLQVYRDSPDVAVAAFTYLASGMVLRTVRCSSSWSNFIGLGIVLGLGYLAKSSMLPLSLIFLASTLPSSLELKKWLPRLLAACLVTLVISAPFITLLSLQKGRFTFGDAGYLNYNWYVSYNYEVPDIHWQGLPEGSGTPKHPTRKIFNDPEIFEFATPIAGTYPPWYDPSYWNEGLKRKFNLQRQLTTILSNILLCWKLFLGCLIAGYFFLSFVSSSFTRMRQDLLANWRILLLAVSGLGGFIIMTRLSPLDPEPWGYKQIRYIAPFIVLLFLAVFSSISLPNSRKIKRLIVGLTISILVAVNTQLPYMVSLTYKTMQTAEEKTENIHWEVAQALSAMGVQPKDQVAILGKKETYWARLARLRIIASLPDQSRFWSVDSTTRLEALNAIEKTGAKALVIEPRLPKSRDVIHDLGWQKVGDTGSYIYIFDKRA